ncbi:FixH family protein [Xanthobacteraceae bacterium A53D]
MSLHQSRPLNQPKPRARGQITGWHVFGALVLFFGIIAGANVTMARFALSTFGGVETQSSYKAGLAFRGEEDAAARQAAKGWHVTLNVTDRADGTRVLLIEARDANGTPLAGYGADARFSHPADARQDVTVPLSDLGGGRYQGHAAVHSGQWALVVDLTQGEDRVFRSRNRVQLR